MKAFAAAGLIAAASAATATTTAPHESIPLSYFDLSPINYDYGYPSFGHKEELTPVKKAPKDHSEVRRYKTNNIDIFAHSSSSEDEYKFVYRSKYHHSDSSSSSEEVVKPKKHHSIPLTGYGPEGDHCHDGDYCGKIDESSDYSDSDYAAQAESSSEEHIFHKPSGCGGEKCARVDFDWNYLNVDGTMDIYQPYGAAPQLLFDADFDNLRPYNKHEVALRSLPKLPGDKCSDTGTTEAWIGTVKTDRNGGGHLRAFNDDICLEDFIGQSMEIRGRYKHDSKRAQLKVYACGNVIEVPCPRRRY